MLLSRDATELVNAAKKEQNARYRAALDDLPFSPRPSEALQRLACGGLGMDKPRGLSAANSLHRRLQPLAPE